MSVLSGSGYVTCVLPAGATTADIFARLRQLQVELEPKPQHRGGASMPADAVEDPISESIAYAFRDYWCSRRARNDPMELGTWVGGTVRLGRRCDPIVVDHRQMRQFHSKMQAWLRERASELMLKQREALEASLGPFAGGRYGLRMTPVLAEQTSVELSGAMMQSFDCDPLPTPLLV